jgi:hypothetical protein
MLAQAALIFVEEASNSIPAAALANSSAQTAKNM